MRKLLGAMIFLVLVFFIGGLMLPKVVQVERSISIQRPSVTVHTLLNGYRMFNRWSPWAGRDPNAVFELSGPVSGVGARLSWAGDPKLVGSGFQEITHSTPFSRVETHLDFGPQGVADAFFDIEPAGDGVTVTWSFVSDVTAGQNFLDGMMGRWVGLFFEKWIGSDYEQGLIALKQLAESLPATDFSDLDVSLVDVAPVDILYVSSQSSQDAADIAATMGSAYAEISEFMVRNDLQMSGQPMAINRGWDEEGYRFDAAIPVSASAIGALSGNVRAGKSPGGRAVLAVHIGPYDNMLPTYARLEAWMAANGISEGVLSWEQYVSNPGETATHELVTHIYFLTGD
jgi:effector-binding domain-containing protein